MPRLLLIRHAESVIRATGSDLARPLTARGRANAKRVGIYLRTSGLHPNRAICSPALRARDTLDAIVHELPQEPPSREVCDALYYANAETLFDILCQTPGSVETLLVTGHNPGIGEFAHLLLRPENDLPRHFPAPCLAVIDIICDDWSEAGAGRGRLDRFKDFSGWHALAGG